MADERDRDLENRLLPIFVDQVRSAGEISKGQNLHEDSVVTWLVGLASGGSAAMLAIGGLPESQLAALLPWTGAVLLGFLYRFQVSHLLLLDSRDSFDKVAEVSVLPFQPAITTRTDFVQTFQRIVKRRNESLDRATVRANRLKWGTLALFALGLVAVAVALLKAAPGAT